jgi:hypothetical protein
MTRDVDDVCVNVNMKLQSQLKDTFTINATTNPKIPSVVTGSTISGVKQSRVRLLKKSEDQRDVKMDA